MHNAQTDVMLRVRTLTPNGYTHDIEPPKPWSRTFGAQQITPHVIHTILRKCYKAGCDMQYIAGRLGVGDAAILQFLKNEKSISITCAEKFYLLFFGPDEETFPKARPDEKPPLWDVPYDTEEPENPDEKKVDSPDIDAEKLALRLIAEREKRGWTLTDVGERLNLSPGNILRAEEGKIFKLISDRSIPLRLCDLYQIDIREYELKPRINFPLFQAKICAAKKLSGMTWDQIADTAQVSRYMVGVYYSTSKRSKIVFLTPQMASLLEVLDIDPAEVVLKGD